MSMDHTVLTVLHGKLIAVESGYALDIVDASEVREEARGFLDQYPDMPQEERERCKALLMAGKPTAGKVH
jgi:hydrogenase maturation factor